MCIIILKEKGVCPPSKRTLKTCFNNNPDGAGFMYLNNGKVSIEKGFMSFKKLRRALKAYQFTHDDIVVYHFRIATCGNVEGSQTHPFPVTDNNTHLKSLSCSTALGFAHNGIFSGMHTTNELSDTMLFAKEILSDRKVRANIFNEESAQSRLIEMASSTSRLAFLDYKGRLKTFGDWEVEKESGLMFSNDDYKYEYRYYKRTSYENVSGYGTNPYNGEKNPWHGNKWHQGFEERDEGMGVCPSCQADNTYDLFTKECYSCGHVDSVEYLKNYERERDALETEREEIERVNAETILTLEEAKIKQLLIQGSKLNIKESE